MLEFTKLVIQDPTPAFALKMKEQLTRLILFATGAIKLILTPEVSVSTANPVRT